MLTAREMRCKGEGLQKGQPALAHDHSWLHKILLATTAKVSTLDVCCSYCFYATDHTYTGTIVDSLVVSFIERCQFVVDVDYLSSQILLDVEHTHGKAVT